MREHNARAWHAWHVAALQRAKRFPKLDKLLTKNPRAKREQGWEEQLRIIQLWNAALGGTVSARKDH